MKVLMVVNWYTSIKESVYTAGVFHREQAIALKDYCDIRLYWPFEINTNKLIQGDEAGLYTYRGPWDEKESKIKWFKNTVSDLKRIIEEFKPDIIHANVAYPAGFICILVAKKYNIPVVLTEHAPIEAMGLNKWYKKKIREYVYNNTYENVCVSIDSMDRLKKIFSKASFRVIYNAVINPSMIVTDGEIYRKNDCINCAIVASFYDEFIKGYQFLLPAIKNVKEKNKKICLHICGGGQYEKLYKDMAVSLGIDEDCVFYGQCDRQKVYSIVKQMDFCISASVYECSGVSVQEEMLMGKPILVTRSGGANSLTTEDTAIVVDRNSIDALTDGILLMMEKYKDFDSDTIKKYAEYNFEISNVTKRNYELYKDVLERENK